MYYRGPPGEGSSKGDVLRDLYGEFLIVKEDLQMESPAVLTVKKRET